MHVPPLVPISSLRADLVPHHEWALRRWFFANPIWYYHRQSTAHQICPGGRFYQLIDPHLRQVCRLLSSAGLRTTPSCQGHSYPRERFEQIWTELNREAPQVRGDGLIVRDCESDRPYLFRRSDWRVPWASFDMFYREAVSHQNEGYLGIIVSANQPDIEERFRRDPYRTRWSTLAQERCSPPQLGGTLFGLRVKAVDEATRQSEWQHFTAYVGALIQSQPGLDRHAGASQRFDRECPSQDSSEPAPG